MKAKVKRYFLLHLLLMFYSSVSILGKLAADEPFLSPGFVLLYGAEILVLGICAIAWQQFIKRMPLSAAYANRAVMIVWGGIWGVLLFREHLTTGKIIGGLLVICGVALYGFVDAQESNSGGEDGGKAEK